MRRLQREQPQLKRELFAMKLYARTGRRLLSASVRLRAALPISEQRAARQNFALPRRPVGYVSVL